MGGHFFGPSELCEHMIPLSAGFGGYHQPRAPSNNRAQLIKEMAKEAAREGWISREQVRYGGIYKYALTEGGRNVYREMIAPQRDAFVEHYLKTREAVVHEPIVPTGEVPKRHRQGGDDTDKEDRIGRLQRRYERGETVSDRRRPSGRRRGRD